MFARFQLPSALTLAAPLIAGSLAIALPAAAQVSALIPPEDAGLSCKAIAIEINDLAEARSRTAQRASDTHNGGGRKLFGFATQALQIAGPMLGSSGFAGSGLGAAVAQAAMTAAQTQAMTAATGGAAPQASPEAQRMERLNALYADKGC